MNTRTTSPEDTFHPVEHAILSNWLGRPRPACAFAIDLRAHHEDAEPEENDEAPALLEGDFIRLRAPEYDAGSEIFNELDNAVARICLEAIQHRLPQWGAVKADGELILARAYDPTVGR